MLSRTSPSRPTDSSAHPVDSADLATEAIPAPTFELSIRQLLASAAAAVTAALLGSRLGVAGTLIGAALASSVTMVAAAVYSHSLATAQYKVKVVRGTLHEDHDHPTVALSTADRAWGQAPAAQPVAAAVQPVAASLRTGVVRAPSVERRRMPRWMAAGVGILAACALALLAVTGIEAVRGTPLSGGESGGLSVLGGNSAGTPDTSSDDHKAPAVDTESNTSDSTTTVVSTVTVPADPSGSTDSPTSSATASSGWSSTSTGSTTSTSATSSSGPATAGSGTAGSTPTSAGTAPSDPAAPSSAAAATASTTAQPADPIRPGDDPRTDRIPVAP